MADFTAGFRRLFAEARQLDPSTLAEPREYYFEDWGASEEIRTKLYDAAVSDGFFENLALISTEVVPCMQMLASEDITIRVMTARPGQEKIEQSLRWLAKNNIPYSEFLSIYNKADVTCDLVIDDAPRQIRNLVNAGRKSYYF